MKIKEVKFFGEKEGIEIYEVKERNVDLAEYLATSSSFYDSGVSFERMINTPVYPTVIKWNRKKIRGKFLYFFRDIESMVKFVYKYLIADKNSPFDFVKNLDNYKKTVFLLF